MHSRWQLYKKKLESSLCIFFEFHSLFACNSVCYLNSLVSYSSWKRTLLTWLYEICVEHCHVSGHLSTDLFQTWWWCQIHTVWFQFGWPWSSLKVGISGKVEYVQWLCCKVGLSNLRLFIVVDWVKGMTVKKSCIASTDCLNVFGAGIVQSVVCWSRCPV